ncbi:MAG: 3-isopropylmalate dehydratase small subunit [Methanocellales archaeon]|nr:3-isopropylmalate dehydratase small subunit [Methanocellales archaeon]MDI6902428.1 3-isopropylmalate dehydratase small subunit [Methanocellales archaeon]
MGNVWKFGDDVNTDAIIPGRYLTINDPKELAKHVFEGVLPEFAQQVQPGDIIVAGRNFGCGSSREHAPLALKGAGISCIIAKSFARIFFRNAINVGLPVLECDKIDQIERGDALEVDLAKGMINNKTKGERYQAMPLPEFVRNIIEHGGLIEYTKTMLGRTHDI